MANPNADLHNRIVRLTPPGHLIVPLIRIPLVGERRVSIQKIKLITTHKYIISMVNN